MTNLNIIECGTQVWVSLLVGSPLITNVLADFIQVHKRPKQPLKTEASTQKIDQRG